MKAKRIFITGGASGLGEALARKFAREGWRVCIADLNEARGQQTLGELRPWASAAEFIRCDVRNEEDLLSAAQRLQALWGGVDVVVNNAGVALAGGIAEVPLADWQWILDINFLGVVRGCKIFTPMFKSQGHGHFVNISSMAGLLDVPLMSSYNASKAAVISLSETLQLELAPANIAVTLACPSFIKTNLAESMRTPNEALRAQMKRHFARATLTADEVAHQIYQGVMSRAFYVLPHSDGRSAWLAKRLLPRKVYMQFMKRTLKRIR